MFCFLLVFGAVFAEFRTLTKKEGETFTIEFPSNPTTGYIWKFNEPQSNEEPILKLLDEKYEPNFKQPTHGPKLAGGGGIHRFVFQTEKRGTMDLEFVHARPWEHTNPIPEVVRVVVE
ncbi:putative Chagasin family peptidase inhibitor I42 [Monocercomonoides exilis]|uniref:putative Chagasin family peptidase inhibitor I42 n=1 Tax=Monocercomonoides exilis TaxID=2049356 RepID=UPI00355AC35B|nr:putative Chagasin family peptidase inhibitor I42 [Monocercomonoides exilis]|eukprot:MONOS_14422.1-p1 / transcript=MONOS_14422.1 / gene=MONOS_14422 / organism=Monocercomonoides_exilis_PA203 / gene_product=unspecified product / transcript_product=unspecified product / location=Mono_scaffold00998:14736-15301(+) / protein_length=117 / sequence_SO=supercontig / SO=protein_coding / is_pseudo=false